MVSASQRFLGRPKVKKDLVTPEKLKALVESKITDKSPSISDLRSVALCLIESSKTDQFRDGAWIVIARSHLPTYPVKALEEYVSAVQIDLSEELPLFKALTSPRSKAMVRSEGIRYSRAPELVKDAFRGLPDVSKLSVHSLRAGGATSTANAGIPDRLFKRHGRWATQTSSPSTKQPTMKDKAEKIQGTLGKILKRIDTLIVVHCSTRETHAPDAVQAIVTAQLIANTAFYCNCGMHIFSSREGSSS
ncbi:hypothetical protein AWC38_SpisGene23259 [Stylophora pistillata]|uniref:Tyr recombinase domain-containing protein n=1 Tax=Stylophora pistillata TaxID=50429 RepID=A0A2B4R314_STYPI|nr:hypothetical protein AWC38_SpisGene23259 [Stylophora pistillata]